MPSIMPNAQHSLHSNNLLQKVEQQGLQSRTQQWQGEQQNSAGQSLQVSASTSTTVSISGYSTKSHTFVPNGVEKYQAIAEDAPQTTEAAQNILSFISRQMELDAADGASTEELTSRLAAGLQGFMQGYSEAAQILTDSGLLSEDLEAEIRKTFDGVLSGIDELAQKYGVESPVGGELLPADEALAPLNQSMSSQPQVTAQQANDAPSSIAEMIQGLSQPVDDLKALLETTEIDYEGRDSRNFSFELRTQDGDVVTITASAERSVSAGYQSVNYGDQYTNVSMRGLQMEASSSSAFSFSVQGDLDEGELGAIGDLMAKVGDLSETFFAGDIAGAFDMAMELGFDGEEIASFSLNLKHETYQKLDNSYGAIGQYEPSEAQNTVADQATFQFQQLARFVQMLEEVRVDAASAGLDNDQLTSAAERVGQQNHAGDERMQGFGKLMTTMLDALGQQQAA